MKCKKCKREIPEDSNLCCYCGSRIVKLPEKKHRRTKGTGSVHKVSRLVKKPWEAQYKGEYIGRFETKAAAVAALNEIYVNGISDYYNIDIGHLYAKWLAENGRELSESMKEQYETAYKHIKSIEDMKIRALRVENLQSIFQEMEEKKLSHSSMVKVKTLLNHLYKLAMRERVIERNDVQFVKLPKEEKTEKAIFAEEEIEILFQNDANETVKLILILIYTGLRIGELFGLRVENIHLEERYMIGGEKTEAGRDRVIPICRTIEAYMQYFLERSTGELLISGYSGNKVIRNFRRRDFEQTLTELQINEPKKTPHSTRHTFASMAVRRGITPERLKEIIGHEDYTTTVNIYTHSNLKDLITEMGKIDGER